MNASLVFVSVEISFSIMPRGYALILCQKSLDSAILEGAEKDAQSLEKTFEDLNLTTEVLRNGTLAKIKKRIAYLSTRDFTNERYVIVSILSYGDKDNVICANDGNYKLDDFVISQICTNKTLADKPKIFFIDACKGPKVPLNWPNDVFVFYSTTDGYDSRIDCEGGIFTRFLCYVIKNKGKSKTFREIANKVIREVCKENRRDAYDQLPTYEDNLSYDFYL